MTLTVSFRHAPSPGRILRLVKRELILSTFLLASIATPVMAQRVEIILDASGSMRGMAGGGTKMEAAKEAVVATINAIETSSNVALRLYGHRLPSEPKEPSCQDTELVIAFGPLNRQRFVAAVEAARPLGQTPLAHSLEQAAEDLGDLGDDSAAVILVSDGEESCGGDPVAVACTFAKRGLDLTVHTVGFDVDSAARTQLQQIARCTSGEYRDARDADELAESMRQLTQAGLLLNRESAYGREIRGGSTYDDAVAIEPGVEYRLDHHQRRNQYDFFTIEATGGQKVVATIHTTEKGVRVSGDSFRETANPYGGIEVHTPERQKIRDAVVIGTPNGRNSVEVPTSHERSGAFYVLVGNAFQDQHKDGRFTVELVDQFDAGSGRDAPAGEDEALEIQPGEHTGWLHANDRIDSYVFRARPGAVYELRVRPEHDEKRLRVTVTDADGVEVAREDAPNAGAAVRVRDLRLPDGGTAFVKVEAHPTFTTQHRVETSYSLELTGEGGEPVTDTGRPSDADDPSSGEPEPASAPAEGSGWLVPVAVAAGVLLAVAAAVVLLRRRPAGE